MKVQITLDGKEVRQLIALALDIPEEKVIPLRYNFAVDGYSEADVKERLRKAGVKTE